MQILKKTNEIKIGNEKIEIYLAEKLLILQKYDQVVLSFNDSNKYKALEVKNCFGLIGLETDSGYITKVGEGINKEIMRELTNIAKSIVEKKYDPEVKIAARDWRVYLGTCLKILQMNNSLTLSALDSYLGTMLYIPQPLNAIGIEIDKEFRNGNRMEIKKKMESIETEKSGRLSEIEVNKLGLTKGPELMEKEDIEICTNDYAVRINKEDIFLLANGNLPMDRVTLRGGLNLKKEKINQINKHSGRPEALIVTKWGITKPPELFMYTK